MATTSVTWKNAGAAGVPDFAAMSVNDLMNVSGKLASINRVRARVGRSQFEAVTGTVKPTFSAKTYSVAAHPTKTATVLVKRLT